MRDCNLLVSCNTASASKKSESKVMISRLLCGAYICSVLFAKLALAEAAAEPQSGPHLDANGWTVFIPSRDSRVIYVSSSTGNNIRDGRSPQTAVATLEKGKSLLRDGHSDQLLLKAGDKWVNQSFGYLLVSGRSSTEPMVISTYGTGPAPEIDVPATGDAVGIGSLSGHRGGDFLAIQGISFYAYTRDPNNSAYDGPNNGAAGTRFLTPITYLLIEGCTFRYFSGNISIDASSTSNLSTAIIRRNVIADAWSSIGHSQGLYAAGLANLTLEDNLFDHNGWNDSIAGATDTFYNHNAYVKENITKLIARGNIFANGASHGLQARSGGNITNNLFLYNPLGMEFGFLNGSPVTPGGVTGGINNNVFEGSRDIAGSKRGIPIQIGNIMPGGDTFVNNNIFLNDNQKAFAAINLDIGSGITNPADAVGINDLTIERNIVYKWYRAIEFDAHLNPGGSGLNALNNVTIRDNDFQLPLSGVLVQHLSPFDRDQEHWSNNRYFSSTSEMSWFTVANTPTSFMNWQAVVEPTAIKQRVQTYPDPDRTVETYNASIGGNPDLWAFLMEARMQSKNNWRAQYTANAVNSYIRAGFGMGSQ